MTDNAAPRTLGESFNVKDAPYNAVGDGVADDTAAIQAAVEAARLSRLEEDFGRLLAVVQQLAESQALIVERVSDLSEILLPPEERTSH